MKSIKLGDNCMKTAGFLYIDERKKLKFKKTKVVKLVICQNNFDKKSMHEHSPLLIDIQSLKGEQRLKKGQTVVQTTDIFGYHSGIY